MTHNTTPLYQLHTKHDPYMVDFAGYQLPLYYKNQGMKQEHLHTRSAVSLFDVSHMGHALITGGDTLVSDLSYLVTADLTALTNNAMVYTTLTNDAGGVIDDCIITKRENGFFVVLNAARKDVDLAHLRAHLPNATIELLEPHALVAVQGPKSSTLLAQYDSDITTMPFMSTRHTAIASVDCWVSRCGYTGEDGFEISVAGAQAIALTQALLKQDGVDLAGLAARDSLRLEAGLCLYGNELNESISPVSAGLTWAIAKTKRDVGAFLGSEHIIPQIGAAKEKLIGLRIAGKVAARSDAQVLHQGNVVGRVTSGVYSPTLDNAPIAMAFVQANLATEETLAVAIRNKQVDAQVAKLPFVAHNYYRG